MAPLEEIIEWIKTVGSLLVAVCAVVAVMVCGIEVLVIFSSGHWAWGLFAFATLASGLYFAARWISQ
jgi:hypothetical protein